VAINTKRYKKRQEESSGNNADIFKIMKGKNYVRIFTMNHKVTERDFETLAFDKDDDEAPKIGTKTDEISRKHRVHIFKGQAPKNCFADTSKCPYCTEAKEMRDEGDDQGARKVSAQTRDAINVVDMKKPKDGMKRLDASPQTLGGIISQVRALLEDEVEESSIFGCQGRDFIITYDKDAPIASKYTVALRDSSKSDALDEDYNDKVVNFYLDGDLDPQDVEKLETEETEPEEAEPEGDTEGLKDEPAAEEGPAETHTQPEEAKPPAAAKKGAVKPAAKKKGAAKPFVPDMDNLVGHVVHFLGEVDGENVETSGKVLEQEKTIIKVEDTEDPEQPWEIDTSEVKKVEPKKAAAKKKGAAATK